MSGLQARTHIRQTILLTRLSLAGAAAAGLPLLQASKCEQVDEEDGGWQGALRSSFSQATSGCGAAATRASPLAPPPCNPGPQVPGGKRRHLLGGGRHDPRRPELAWQARSEGHRAGAAEARCIDGLGVLHGDLAANQAARAKERGQLQCSGGGGGTALPQSSFWPRFAQTHSFVTSTKNVTIGTQTNNQQSVASWDEQTQRGSSYQILLLA